MTTDLKTIRTWQTFIKYFSNRLNIMVWRCIIQWRYNLELKTGMKEIKHRWGSTIYFKSRSRSDSSTFSSSTTSKSSAARSFSHSSSVIRIVFKIYQKWKRNNLCIRWLLSELFMCYGGAAWEDKKREIMRSVKPHSPFIQTATSQQTSQIFSLLFFAL
jgi:hypothetical protein